MLVVWIFQHKRMSKGCWWWWFDVLVVWIFQHKRMSMCCWWCWFDVLVVWIFQRKRIIWVVVRMRCHLCPIIQTPPPPQPRRAAVLRDLVDNVLGSRAASKSAFSSRRFSWAHRFESRPGHILIEPNSVSQGTRKTPARNGWESGSPPPPPTERKRSIG